MNFSCFNLLNTRILKAHAALHVALLLLLCQGIYAELTCISCCDGLFLKPVDDRNRMVNNEVNAHGYQYRDALEDLFCGPCPRNMSVPLQVNGSSVADCRCEAGYVYSDDSNQAAGCDACPHSKYKTAQTAFDDPSTDICTDCPANSSHDALAAITRSDCECNAGFYNGYDADFALEIPDDRYCNECVVGFYKATRGNNDCEFCPADTYCDATGTITPTPCYENSFSPQNSFKRYHCNCNAGYYQESPANENEMCVACPQGTYQGKHVESEPTSCTLCPVDTFNPNTTSETKASCQDCPANAQSQEGSTDVTDCHCNAGYSGDVLAVEDLCTACAPGHFKTFDTTIFICSQCVIGKYNVDHASTSDADCTSCGDEKTTMQPGTARPADCVCRAGYRSIAHTSEAGHECEQCETGKYQPSTNTSACLLCAAGKYNGALRMTTESACQVCDDGYVAVNDGASQCVACPQDTWQDTSQLNYTAVACASCPLNSENANTGSYDINDCRCMDGYVKDASVSPFVCQLCPAGHFCKGQIAIPCLVNEWAVEAVNVQCQTCPINSYAVFLGAKMTDRSLCACRPGFQGLMRRYAELGDGATDDDCTSCAEGFIQPRNWAMAGANVYELAITGGNYGFQFETHIGEWSYQVPNTDIVLVLKVDNHNGLTRHAIISNNPVSSVESLTQFEIDPTNMMSLSYGHFMNDKTSASGNLIIDATLSHEYPPWYDIGERVPSVETAEPSITEQLPTISCTGCGVGEYTMLEEDYADADAFVFEGGTTYTDAVAAYKDAGHADVFWRCQSCPANSTSPAESHRPESCKCLVRHHGKVETPSQLADWEGSFPVLPESLNACQFCEAGFWCPGHIDNLGTAPQNACKEDSLSVEGSSVEEACDCLPGFYSINQTAACQTCPERTYCEGDTHQENCPDNSFSPPGSDSQQDCGCQAGYWRGCIFSVHHGEHLDQFGFSCEIDYTVSCYPCGANHICNSNSLYACPDHSYANPGSGELSDCKCFSGYERVESST